MAKLWMDYRCVMMGETDDCGVGCAKHTRNDTTRRAHAPFPAALLRLGRRVGPDRQRVRQRVLLSVEDGAHVLHVCVVTLTMGGGIYV